MWIAGICLLAFFHCVLVRGEETGNSLVTCTACQSVQAQIDNWSCRVNRQVANGNNGILSLYTLQEHQRVPTNKTVAKQSDWGFAMVIYEKKYIKVEKFQHSSDHLSIKCIYAVWLLTHSSYFLTKTLLFSHSVTFVRILWCSCRVIIQDIIYHHSS